MFTCVGSAKCQFVACKVDLGRCFSMLSFWSSGPNLHHVREDRGRYSICCNYHVSFHGGFLCCPDIDAVWWLLQALKCWGHSQQREGEGLTGYQSCRLWSQNPAQTLFSLLSKGRKTPTYLLTAVQDSMVPGWSKACRNRLYVSSPLLFLFYINDLPEVVKSTVWLYKWLPTLPGNPLLLLLLQEHLHRLEKWAAVWGMKLNAQKCYILPTKARSSFLRSLGGVILKQVQHSPYLSVHISNGPPTSQTSVRE